ncbi:MAG: hypothetical protein ACHQEA_03955 [Gaiellales bacterium]|jgi:hypothetical protein
MGAGSKFDQPLTLLGNGHQVVACGPLRFDGCDVSARVSIDLKQRANPGEYQPSRGRATASGDFPNPNYDEELCDARVGDEEDEWMLTATVVPYPVTSATPASAWATAAFVTAPNPGPLIEGRGSIVYTRNDGTTKGFQWKGTGHPHNADLGAR